MLGVRLRSKLFYTRRNYCTSFLKGHSVSRHTHVVSNLKPLYVLFERRVSQAAKAASYRERSSEISGNCQRNSTWNYVGEAELGLFSHFLYGKEKLQLSNIPACGNKFGRPIWAFFAHFRTLNKNSLEIAFAGSHYSTLELQNIEFTNNRFGPLTRQF